MTHEEVPICFTSWWAVAKWHGWGHISCYLQLNLNRVIYQALLHSSEKNRSFYYPKEDLRCDGEECDKTERHKNDNFIITDIIKLPKLRSLGRHILRKNPSSKIYRFEGERRSELHYYRLIIFIAPKPICLPYRLDIHLMAAPHFSNKWLLK